MKNRYRSLLQFLLFLAIGAGILYLVYSQQNAAYQEECLLKGLPPEKCHLWKKVLSDFGRVNYGLILLSLLAFAVSNVSRTLRWRQLIEPLNYRPRFLNGFLSIMLGYFANLGIPRMGEVVRAATLARYEKIPAEKIMGTVVVDRIVDALCLAVVMGLAFLFEFERLWSFVQAHRSTPESGGGGSWGWWLGGVGVVVAGGLLLTYRHRGRLNGWAPFRKVVEILRGFVEGLKTVRRVSRPGLFIAHSLNIWLMYFLMTWLGLHAFPPTAHLDMTAALAVFAAGGLGIVIPAPGGMGSYHFLVIGALALYGIPGDDGFSSANILFFSVNIGANILLGLLALLFLPLYNKRYVPARMNTR